MGGQEVHGKGLRDRPTLRGTGMAFRTARAMVAACALLQLAQPATGFTAVHVGGDVGAGRPSGVLPALTRLRPARGTCASGACSLSAVAVGGGSSQGSGSGRQDGDWDQEVAMRIMIERNRAARENADRAYIPMDVAVRWARQMKLWGSREAWEEWIEQNRDSNPFIPPNPEEYYTVRGGRCVFFVIASAPGLSWPEAPACSGDSRARRSLDGSAENYRGAASHAAIMKPL